MTKSPRRFVAMCIPGSTPGYFVYDRQTRRSMCECDSREDASDAAFEAERGALLALPAANKTVC